MFHWVLPVMLALVALTSYLSDRDLSQVFAELATGIGSAMSNPIVPWAQRFVSLFLLLVSIQRIADHFVHRKPMPSAVLAWAYIAYWTGTVATPALLGSHPQIGHEFLYSLVIGIGGLMVTAQDAPKIVNRARDALFVFILVGVLLIPIQPAMVLDLKYNQGLIPGLPRLGGLAPHAVAMGMFAQTFLLCLWARPYEHRWLTLLAWVTGLGALFMAQSKTAWIAFVLCAIAMLAVRNGGKLWRRLGDPREGAFGIVVCLGVMLFGAALLGWVLLGDVEAQLSDFFDTAQGAQLVSMTGRDQIWAIAIEEWHANKLFGYGPGLWDEEFRASIGLPNATSAHNQFMDTLARAGTVGAIALVFYAAVLCVMSLRYAKTTGGLSLALFIALALRSVSEVPLLLFGYGTEFFVHLLLVLTLAAGASTRTLAVPARMRPAYGMAS
jgi:hypothetical protein